MDYEALAKQFGGTTTAAPVDYAALAKQFGGTTDMGPPEPSAWDKVRPYVAPALEMVGAAGGGLVGGASGVIGGPVGALTMGTVGAGLGYAGSKELLNIADTYLGGKPSTTNAMARVGENTLEGAAYEAGGGVVGKVLAKPASAVFNKLGSMLGTISDLGAHNKAIKILKQAVGAEDRAAVVNALREAPEGVLPAQTLAENKLPEFQALAELTKAKNPKPFNKVLDAQRAATLGELEALAGGSNQTQVREGLAAAKTATNAELMPQRDLALRTANIAGEKLPGLQAEAEGLSNAATDAVDMVRRLVPAGERAGERAAATTTPTGMRLGSAGKYTWMGELQEASDKWASRAADASLNLGEGARFAKYAADSLAAHGLKPLESAPIISAIEKAAAADSYAGNLPVKAALREVADEIAQYTNKGGVIHGEALDAIRKNSVNALIQKNLGTADPKTQQKAAAEILGHIKPLIDDAIEAAGGTGYKDYLAKYSAAMQEQARTKLAGKALQLYKESPSRFVKMVNGDAPKDVEKILGPGNFNIQTEVSPEAFDVLKRAATGIERAKMMKEQAGEGRAALAEIIKSNTFGFKIPNFFSMKATVANSILDQVEARLSSRTLKELDKAFASGASMQDMLHVLPAAERTELRRALSNSESWLPRTLVGAGAGSNALSPENQNAMAQ